MTHNTKENESLQIKHPDRLVSYFKREIRPLLFVAVTGLMYNIGLAAEPFFEGQLVQKLLDVMKKKSSLKEMVILAVTYVMVILFVQGARCVKRFYTRRFANDTSLNMRHMIYNFLVHQKKSDLASESVGAVMTKAVADVDACSEGMRKFLTEIFDTGIAMLAYLALMFYYDWHLTLLAIIFVIAAILIAQKLKTFVYRYNVLYKKAAGQLNDATLDRVSGSLTYRVAGREDARNQDYEQYLSHYEKAAVKANIWENTFAPLYNVISMISIVFILYFGAKNVLGTGYQMWNIGVFTAFVSCFTKMTVKSSKVAKLLNALQKASVSWKRIKPLMQEHSSVRAETLLLKDTNNILKVSDVAFGYEKNQMLFCDLSFVARPGDVIGVTGPVACGKTSFGRLFLGEESYKGNILYGNKELFKYTDFERNMIVSYLGHDEELMSDTIENNICMGEQKDIMPYIKATCLEEEIASMPEGIHTQIGAGGIRLSGGQQARLALARTLYHAKKIMILDDPFSAVDLETEKCIMENIREMLPHAIIILLSHRITLFSEFNQIVWMQNAKVSVGTHVEILQREKGYASIYQTQRAGGELDV